MHGVTRRSWFLLLVVMVVCVAAVHAQPAKKLALVGGMLLDGYEVPPLHHAAVLIEGNKIVEVGRAAEITIPSDATVIDTSGRTMLPGLIEAHAHMGLLGHGNYARWFPWKREHDLEERVWEISSKQFINAGITSAIDLGGPLDVSLRVRDRINRGELVGPRLLVSGPMLRGGEEAMPGMGKVETPEAAARNAEALAKAGVDVIKAQIGIDKELYVAIVETAHKYGKKVHAHVYFPDKVKAALDAGVDVLTHVGSAGTPPYTPELMREIVVSGRPVVPTGAHRVWVVPATINFPERLQDPQLKEDFGPMIYEEVQDSFKNWHTLPYFGPLIGLGDTPRQMFFGDASLKQWIDSGAVVGMGTDSGTPMNFNTEALWREMKAFVDLGMSPQRTISAATRINARIMGMGSELGTIEPGKLADIIVVKGDPLFNIMALADVEVVVKDGVVLKGGPGSARRPTSDGRF